MIPSGYSRSSVYGALPNGEIWQIGMWADEAPSSAAAAQAQADAFAGDLADAWPTLGGPASFCNSEVKVQGVSVYSYTDSSGHASYVGNSVLALAGIGGSQTMPNQVACVHTLETAFSGRRARGRVYWPVNTGALSSGQLALGDCTSLAGWTADLIDSWNGHLGDQHIVVLSQAGGTSHPVTGVKVDSHLDIQRRRANGEAILHQYTATVESG